MPFDPNKSFTVEKAPAFDPKKKFTPEAAPPPAQPAKQTFFDKAWRGAQDLYSGGVEGLAGLVDAGGKFADMVAQTNAGAGADTGYIFDPTSGQAIPVPQGARAGLRQVQTDHVQVATPVTSRAAAAMKAHAAQAAPANPTMFDKFGQGAGKFAIPLAATILDPLAGAGLFGLEGFGKSHDEAIAAGAGEDAAQLAGLENMGVQAGVGMLPFGKAVETVLPAAKTALGGVLSRTAAHVAGDAAMGGAMQAGENVVAQQNYAPERSVGAGVPEAAASMAVMGGLLHTTINLPGGMRALAEHFRAKGVDPQKVDLESLAPDDMAEAVADPRVQAILDANNIGPDHPARAKATAVAAERLAARDAAAADPLAQAEPATFRAPERPEGAPAPSPAAVAGDRVDQTIAFREQQRQAAADAEARATLPAGEPDRIDPSRLPPTPEPAPAEPMRVTPEGQAFTPDEGSLRGQELRKPSNLPVPVEPPVRRMSDAEIAQAQAEGNRNPVQPRDTMAAPEGRLPQTREDAQGQREAGGAFALADRQAARVAPEVRDTQPGGLPEGPKPQRVLMDEGFPVQVTDDLGRGRVKVQRYDPRTGQLDPEAVPYETHMAGLSQKPYVAEPRRAQDFAARDNPEAMSPEQPRSPGQPVAREPTQTFRETAQDNPPTEGPFSDSPARPPLPEQPAGPHPGPSQPRGERAQRAANEEELRQRYEQAQQAGADREREAQARQSSEGRASNAPAPKDADGRFPVTEQGYVKSDKGGPIVFKEQKQAAKWITSTGHKESPDQIFEIANHPTVKAKDSGRSSEAAYTVVERGRSAPEPDGGARTHAEAEAAEAKPDKETPAENAAETQALPKAEAEPTPAQPEPKAEAAEAKPDAEGPAETKRELTDDELDAMYERFKKGGTKLNSGLDPADIQKHLLEPAMKAAKAAVEKLATSLKNSTAIQTLGRVKDQAAISVAGTLHGLAKKHPDIPQLRELADHIATDPGSGRATSEPYEYASRRVANQGYNAAKNVMDDWAKATKITPEALRKAMTGNGMAAADRPYAARLRRVLDDWHKQLTAAGLDVGKVENFFPRVPDPLAVENDTAGFLKAAEDVYRAEGSGDPKAAAKAWLDEILTGGDLHVSRAPGQSLTTRSTRERVFKTGAADKLLAKFMQDPKTTLANYFTRTGQQMEFARRFGAKGEKLETMLEAISAKMSPADFNSLRYVVDSGLGLHPSTKPNAVSSAIGWVNTVYTMATLARSLTAQVSEPFVAAVTTGDVRVGLHALGEYFAPLTAEGRASRADAAERAEALGLLSELTDDAMNMNRAGVDAQAGTAQSKMLTAFFKMNGVHGITDFQTRSAGKIAEWYLRGLLRDVVKPNNAPALRALADQFGMDEATARKVAAWAGKYGDKAPPVSDFLGSSQEGTAYQQGVYRFATQNVQNPTRADRPAAAQDPRMRMAYGLTSFLYTFTRKVTIKAMRDMGHALDPRSGYTLPQRAQQAIGLATAYGIYSAANYGIWYARQKALNPQVLDEMTPTQAAYTAMTASQSFGTAQLLIDPALAAAGRYKRDLSTLYTGPYITGALTDVAKVMGGLQGGSDKTNNAEWNGWRAFYHIGATAILLPTLTKLAEKGVPGGVAGKVGLFALMQVAAAPGTSRAFADAAAGERTVKPHGKPVAHKGAQSTLGDNDGMTLGNLSL